MIKGAYFPAKVPPFNLKLTQKTKRNTAPKLIHRLLRGRLMNAINKAMKSVEQRQIEIESQINSLQCLLLLPNFIFSEKYPTVESVEKHIIRLETEKLRLTLEYARIFEEKLSIFMIHGKLATATSSKGPKVKTASKLRTFWLLEEENEEKVEDESNLISILHITKVIRRNKE